MVTVCPGAYSSVTNRIVNIASLHALNDRRGTGPEHGLRPDDPAGTTVGNATEHDLPL
ncbi:hypothetical protein GCM10022236_52360 [Microlunatus ginsengisoli]|uniref:Uncharacterized protein n=1 Tax=Microlunatus ginsengisoli TaxID=363863 RepID=A0ABP7AXU5_9ACTN